MPKFTFSCDKCKKCFQKYTSVSVNTAPCPDCKSEMTKQLPKLSGSVEVRETVDKDFGVKWKQDQQEMIKDRRDEYFWKIEVPRLVQSGTYCVSTMLELGWIWLDDNNTIHVNTKPPCKR